MKDLSIIIPVFNKFNFTRSCLHDLKQLDLNRHEIIVINNASTDETHEELSRLNWIKYIALDNNYGYSKANNIAFSLSEGKNILFLNNDIKIKSNHSNWTDILINNCQENTLIGPTFGLLDKQFNFIKESNIDLSKEKYSYLSGWCLAGTKTTFNSLIINNYLGPFSEEYGRAYFEDTDLNFRAKNKGFILKHINVPVVHFGKITSKQLNTALLYKSAKEIFIKKWQKLS